MQIKDTLFPFWTPDKGCNVDLVQQQVHFSKGQSFPTLSYTQHALTFSPSAENNDHHELKTPGYINACRCC